jgi:hypothetical protein
MSVEKVQLLVDWGRGDSGHSAVLLAGECGRGDAGLMEGPAGEGEGQQEAADVGRLGHDWFGNQLNGSRKGSCQKSVSDSSKVSVCTACLSREDTSLPSSNLSLISWSEYLLMKSLKALSNVSKGDSN